MQNVAYLKPINQNRALKKIADSLHEIKKYDILECFESSGVGFMEGDILRNITGYFFGEILGMANSPKICDKKIVLVGRKSENPTFRNSEFHKFDKNFANRFFTTENRNETAL